MQHHMQQQSNAHLATQAKLYSQHSQQHHHDYRSTQQSPNNVFQSHPQYQSLASNFAQVNAPSHNGPPQLHVKPLGGGQSSQQQQQQQHYNMTEEQALLLREQVYQSSAMRERQQQPLIRQQPMPPPGHQLAQPVNELQQQYQQLRPAMNDYPYPSGELKRFSALFYQTTRRPHC